VDRTPIRFLRKQLNPDLRIRLGNYIPLSETKVCKPLVDQLSGGCGVGQEIAKHPFELLRALPLLFLACTLLTV
jgi:hypothetical protein